LLKDSSRVEESFFEELAMDPAAGENMVSRE
jgi:hypothetical protein